MQTIDKDGVMHDDKSENTGSVDAAADAGASTYDIDQVIIALSDPNACGGCGIPIEEMTGPPIADEAWRWLCPPCHADIGSGFLDQVSDCRHASP